LIRYNDTTLDQVVKFLDVVENQATQKNTPIIVKTDAVRYKKTNIPCPHFKLN